MRALVPAALLWLSACTQVNPNVGRFSCTTTADCGTDFECRAQFAGGGRCFRVGECKNTEVCDGADENCDGRIDETFPESGEPCTTGKAGVCSAGTRTCVVGALACAQTVAASDERCNMLDDNCNGQTDETFDLTIDNAHCGACTRACAVGTTCMASTCQETRCDDADDNDLDGLTDCRDPSCLGQACATPMPPPWRCGVLSVDGGVDAGVDAGAPTDAGLWFGCYPPEADCANGLDDDGDGAADCLDVDCADRLCVSGTTCTNRMCPGPG